MDTLVNPLRIYLRYISCCFFSVYFCIYPSRSMACRPYLRHIFSSHLPRRMNRTYQQLNLVDPAPMQGIATAQASLQTRGVGNDQEVCGRDPSTIRRLSSQPIAGNIQYSWRKVQFQNVLVSVNCVLCTPRENHDLKIVKLYHVCTKCSMYFLVCTQVCITAVMHGAEHE
jgi:hypothetical protein